MKQSPVLKKIARLTFPDHRGDDDVTVECADAVNRGDAASSTTVHWLVDLAEAEHADPDAKRKTSREVLPFSSGVPILPTQTMELVARTQVDLLLERFFISPAGTPGGAGDWVVHDLRIDGQSQFVQPGDLPGDMFATNAIDAYMVFDPAPANIEIAVVATYVGSLAEGAPFFGAMQGWSYERRPAFIRVGGLGPEPEIHVTPGSALVSRAFLPDGRRPVRIYIPPIDQATMDVAVDAVLAVGEATDAVHTMLSDALGDRGALAHAAYVALVEQTAAKLAAQEERASARQADAAAVRSDR